MGALCIRVKGHSSGKGSLDGLFVWPCSGPQGALLFLVDQSFVRMLRSPKEAKGAEF